MTEVHNKLPRPDVRAVVLRRSSKASLLEGRRSIARSLHRLLTKLLGLFTIFARALAPDRTRLGHIQLIQCAEPSRDENSDPSWSTPKRSPEKVALLCSTLLPVTEEPNSQRGSPEGDTNSSDVWCSSVERASGSQRTPIPQPFVKRSKSRRVSGRKIPNAQIQKSDRRDLVGGPSPIKLLTCKTNEGE
jgi:hypothetical protein